MAQCELYLGRVGVARLNEIMLVLVDQAKARIYATSAQDCLLVGHVGHVTPLFVPWVLLYCQKIAHCRSAPMFKANIQVSNERVH